ncbi:MAG: PEPxxWA-CTERM sorting domain-containing protein [Pseudomonadota bacterium]|nr:PEPxxWA-CTERM sorting domain-containing protein [Pseudomonadota bacterium]
MKTAYKLLTVAALLAASETALASTNLILNGDFEINNAVAGQYQFNLSNAEFSALVNDVTAYGTSAELDLYTSGSGYEPNPQSGAWEVRLHGDGGGLFDAFSFRLSSPVVSGTSYNLRFYVAGDLGMNPIGPLSIKVGLSSDASSFGALLYTSNGLIGTGSWNQYDYSFIAANDASYLTVQNVSVSAVVDNFLLAPVPEPETWAMLLAGLGLVGWAARQRR